MTGERDGVDDWVLVVDDDDDVRAALSELVELGGCRAVGAADGQQALEILRKGLPCLVILDLMMPRMTGEELLEKMRGDEALRDVAVVIATSAPHRAPSGVPVMVKPLDVDVVWAWMRRTCRCTLAPS